MRDAAFLEALRHASKDGWDVVSGSLVLRETSEEDGLLVLLAAKFLTHLDLFLAAPFTSINPCPGHGIKAYSALFFSRDLSFCICCCFF